MADSGKSALNVMEGIEQPSQVNNDLLNKFKKSGRKELSTREYTEEILAGNRTILSQAITLIESSLPRHQEKAQEILAGCLKDCYSPFAVRYSQKESSIQKVDKKLQATKSEKRKASIRIGITGVPGVGKSTFIEALGKYLTSQGHKLAVLAIDPSSSKSKGSILGDKTRMVELSADPYAFIRPSPSAGSLGGVARKTRETILLCEAAGFDVIFVETVGVGQSETAVHSMVDFFLLLMLAGAGDELQGIKRGIIEMADAIFINKADGDNIAKAMAARIEYVNALHLFPPPGSGWLPPVALCSSLTKDGIPEAWNTIRDYCRLTRDNGYFDRKRKEQNLKVLYETLDEAIKTHFYTRKDISHSLKKLEKEIMDGKVNPYFLAQQLAEKHLSPTGSHKKEHDGKQDKKQIQ